MDFTFDDDVEELRREVRAFLEDALADAAAHTDPRDLTGLDEAFERDLHLEAGARGWLSLSGERRAVFELEVARADAPLIDTAMTLAGNAVGAHRPDLLPRMQLGELEICIAYTEPAAGSDLGAVEATAVATDDGWVLNGRKVLVTGAHKADLCCTIARTDPAAPIRERLTMFLIDMSTPGVEVVRRETMNGWTLDEVHLEGVRVGPDDVLGEIGEGWTQLIAAVAEERAGMFWVGFAEHLLDLVVDHVRTAERDGRRLRDDAIARDTVARLAADVRVADRLARRALASPGDPTWSSLAKIAATEILQSIAQAATELAGHAGLLWAPLFGAAPPGAAAGGRFAWEYLERVHGTIGAGANEVHRDTVARFGIGLPRSR